MESHKIPWFQTTNQIYSTIINHHYPILNQWVELKTIPKCLPQKVSPSYVRTMILLARASEKRTACGKAPGLSMALGHSHGTSLLFIGKSIN